jgi:hypothetical protein
VVRAPRRADRMANRLLRFIEAHEEPRKIDKEAERPTRNSRLRVPANPALTGPQRPAGALDRVAPVFPRERAVHHHGPDAL